MKLNFSQIKLNIIQEKQIISINKLCTRRSQCFYANKHTILFDISSISVVNKSLPCIQSLIFYPVHKSTPFSKRPPPPPIFRVHSPCNAAISALQDGRPLGLTAYDNTSQTRLRWAVLFDTVSSFSPRWLFG